VLAVSISKELVQIKISNRRQGLITNGLVALSKTVVYVHGSIAKALRVDFSLIKQRSQLCLSKKLDLRS
jgi:hypothetical protein